MANAAVAHTNNDPKCPKTAHKLPKGPQNSGVSAHKSRRFSVKKVFFFGQKWAGVATKWPIFKKPRRKRPQLLKKNGQLAKSGQLSTREN